MFDPYNIEVDCLAVLNRKTWDLCSKSGWHLNFWTVKSIVGHKCKIVNATQEAFCMVSELIRCPVQGDVVRVYKPVDINELTKWHKEQDQYLGKECIITHTTFSTRSDGIIFGAQPKDNSFYCERDSFHPWWLINEEAVVQKAKNTNPLYCSCDVPAKKMVDYSMGGGKKEYAFCTCCKKEIL